MTTSWTSASSTPRSTARSPRRARPSGVALLAAGLALVLVAACGPGKTGSGADGGTDGGPTCQWDDSSGPSSSVPLTLGQATTGWICPVQDVDWYSFDTGASDHLVRVQLAMDGPLSPVQPTYTITQKKADGTTGKVTATPPAAEVGGALDMVSCMAPGSYYIDVRDQNDDGEDFRHPYSLTVTSSPDPDPAEPNDDAASATALTSGTPATGYIACRGDQDWYRIQVGSGQLLRVHLTSDKANYQPTVAIVDAGGSTLLTLTNPAGAVKATDLTRLVAVPSAGAWYLAVQDDDGMNADPTVAYTLTASTLTQKDPNEPNDSPSQATALSPVSCGTSWSSWQTLKGTFATIGDQDWFRLPISGCNNGLLEATVTMDTSGMSAQQQWDLQSQVQASVALIRPHLASACSKDTDCQELQQPCQSGWDCAGYFNQCQPDGLCAGSGTCLAESVCGATEAAREYSVLPVPSPVNQSPPPDTSTVSAPLFGGGYVYLRVSDFQANGSAPDTFYTLKVRVRKDPDGHEPSNVYTPTIRPNDPTGPQKTAALNNIVPVHDCANGDCCDATKWVTGSLGYEMDQDWYAYQHPCPGADCMVKVLYQLDPGPVDFLITTWDESGQWFGNLANITEKPSQSAISGSYGGTQATDKCYYAWQGHTGSPYYYFVSVRDYADVHDWDPDQKYRFCVEKVADGCSDPCQLYSNGCGCKLSDPACKH